MKTPEESSALQHKPDGRRVQWHSSRLSGAASAEVERFAFAQQPAAIAYKRCVPKRNQPSHSTNTDSTSSDSLHKESVVSETNEWESAKRCTTLQEKSRKCNTRNTLPMRPPSILRQIPLGWFISSNLSIILCGSSFTATSHTTPI